jgi:hypothetical protein
VKSMKHLKGGASYKSLGTSDLEAGQSLKGRLHILPAGHSIAYVFSSGNIYVSFYV